MAERKQFQSELTATPALKKLLAKACKDDVPDEVLQEQRISFAFGNAPESELITKDSVRLTSKSIRLQK